MELLHGASVKSTARRSGDCHRCKRSTTQTWTGRQSARTLRKFSAPSATRKVTLENAELQYFGQRLGQVRQHFPGTLAADDFLARAEIALCTFGFRGDNSIACTNLCRDASTGVLKSKIDLLFGSSFNTNGLGGVLTCGCTGIAAGLSHSPVCNLGKERYVFFSFPHISIDSTGSVGVIDRPGRPVKSYACSVLMDALSQMQETGLGPQVKAPGLHDPMDPEFSILKQRLARRIQFEGHDVDSMTLVDITMVAERMITNDLRYIISKTVDTKRADYAVVTGVLIHNWAKTGSDAPNMEFIMPGQAFVVINGKRTDLDLAAVPALSPRQMALLATARETPDLAGSFLQGTTVVETRQSDPAAKSYQHAARFAPLTTLPDQRHHEVPAWASTFAQDGVHASPDGENMTSSTFEPTKEELQHA